MLQVQLELGLWAGPGHFSLQGSFASFLHYSPPWEQQCLAGLVMASLVPLRFIVRIARTGLFTL